MNTIILGAGLAGTVMYGVLNKNATVIEQKKAHQNSHYAVLHFATAELGRILDLPIQKVRVQKLIFYKGQHYAVPNLFLSNLYSQKALGVLANRSIGNLDTVERWITTDDRPFNHTITIDQLFGCKVMKIENREVTYGCEGVGGEVQVNTIPYTQLISTLPMPVLLELTKTDRGGDVSFKYEPIWVYHGRLPYYSEVCQTVYFPDPDFPVYRATLDERMLILEAVEECTEDHLEQVVKAMGIEYHGGFITKKQEYGKIVPLPPDVGKDIMYRLTTEHNIWSLGRFATWKQVKLDDIYKDALKIKDWMGRDEQVQKYMLKKEVL